jgi:tape measure domain-containing protein
VGSKDAKLKIVVNAQDNTKGTFKALNAQLGQSQGSLKSVAGIAAGLTAGFYALSGAIGAVSGFLRTGFGVAAQLETAQIGLATLLGSTEEAATTIARLKVEAARTPFELPGLTQATQLLSSVTKSGDKSINILLDIGEALAAMGKGQAELDRIIVNLQQVGAIGYASMVDIKQFAYAGIPIFEMLQKQTGLSGEALEDFISNGQVSFDMLTGMFDKANDAGGQFFNAFKNQAGTFNQSLSNLKDSFGIFAADFVENSGAFDRVKEAMQTAAAVLTNYQMHTENLKARIGELFQTIDEKTGLITLLKDAWANVVFMYQERLKPALDELWVTLQPYKPFLDALVQVFGVMLVTAIGGTIMVLGALAAGVIEALTLMTKWYTFLAGTFASIWDYITDKIAATIEVVEKFISLLQRAVSLVGGLPGKAAGGLGKVFGVNDAIISPKGDIITTHPEDYLIATKNPASLLSGGGVTVNINGGMYLSEDAAERMGDLILQRLKLSNAI